MYIIKVDVIILVNTLNFKTFDIIQCG
jgi:hypothetical protein